MNDSNQDAFNKLDKESLKKEIKQEAVKEAQDALISKLQGDKKDFSWEQRGKDQPDSYKEMFAESDRRADEKINAFKDEMASERKDKAEKETKRQEDDRKKQLDDLDTKRKSFDTDWYDLVQQGKMPKVNKDTQERINKGEKLTKEEIMADDGLKARLELAQSAQKSGKGAKLAFYENYKQEPAGADAPVLGSRPRTPQKQTGDDYSYEDVQKERRKMFGY